jgi:dihydrolipoamide dehydrogenase
MGAVHGYAVSFAKLYKNFNFAQNLIQMYDVAITGAGPAGYTAAQCAARAGFKTVLFEKQYIGGVCLNEGCIPTKTLLYSAKTLDTVRQAAKYGINVDASPLPDIAKIMARKNRVVRRLCAGIRQKLTSLGVEIVQAQAILKGEDANGNIKIDTHDASFVARYVIVATGSQTVIPPIAGLNETDYWTSAQALCFDEVPQSIVIVGAGVIGMEFASLFNSLGSKVSVVEMLPEILPSVDTDMAAMLRSEYSRRGIDFYLKTKVTAACNENVQIEQLDGKRSLPCRKILLSVGREPVSKNLGLESLNIELDRQAVKVNNRMQTSHPRVYACGDITGISMLAHTAVRQAEVAVASIAGENESMDYSAIPAVVYTQPELASVGYTVQQMQQKGEPYSVVNVPFGVSGRFVAENEMANGVCQLLANGRGEICGCHLLGNPASEIIVMAGIAIASKMTPAQLSRFVFPHPTTGEVLREAAAELHAKIITK